MQTWVLALAAFVITALLILWRPGGIHEAVPAMLGAFLFFLVGLVDRRDVLTVMAVVWNSTITIIATFVMAAVLEGAGFFRWVGERLIERANGSGVRLFHLVLAFSACLTLFLNNDGSILLGTPIVIGVVRSLRLPRKAAFGYLLGACLIASVASLPVGVSNAANLEAMSLVGITLIQHLESVIIPALIGLSCSWGLLHLAFRRVLPTKLEAAGAGERPPAEQPPLPHPHALRRQPLPHPIPLAPHRLPPHHLPPPPPPPPHGPRPEALPPDREPAAASGFMWFAVGVVVLVRAGYFAASVFQIPTYVVAVAGAAFLLLMNVWHRVVDPRESLRKAPWAILGFALGMDLIVFGLRNAGITGFVAHWLGPAIATRPEGAAFLPGLLSAGVSALLNNHPGLIIGSLTLLQIAGLQKPGLHVAYSGVVLGSDLGALITPAGTLASLIWLHMLRQEGHRYSWWDYVRVTAMVIPLSFFLALCGLYGVARWTGL